VGGREAAQAGGCGAAVGGAGGVRRLAGRSGRIGSSGRSRSTGAVPRATHLQTAHRETAYREQEQRRAPAAQDVQQAGNLRAQAGGIGGAACVWQPTRAGLLRTPSIGWTGFQRQAAILQIQLLFQFQFQRKVCRQTLRGQAERRRRTRLQRGERQARLQEVRCAARAPCSSVLLRPARASLFLRPACAASPRGGSWRICRESGW